MAKKSRLFDLLNDINHGKKNLLTDDEDGSLEKDYVPYVINTGLSLFSDTIFLANEMNLNHNIPKKYQYEFLLASVPKRKRFKSWPKKKKEIKIDTICEYYNCSHSKAEEYLLLMDDEQYNRILQDMDVGG